MGPCLWSSPNRILKDRSYRVPLHGGTPAEAADILLQLSWSYHWCLCEYFLTDLVAHRGSLRQAVLLLEKLDTFLFELTRQADLKRTSILITSDYDNIELMDPKRSTKNPVPTLLWDRFRDISPAMPKHAI